MGIYNLLYMGREFPNFAEPNIMTSFHAIKIFDNWLFHFFNRLFFCYNGLRL